MIVIDSHLDDRPQPVRGAERIVSFRHRRAPPSASPGREPELPAAPPDFIHAPGAGDVVKSEDVSEDEKIAAPHTVGRDRRVDVDEGIVLDDPICGPTSGSMALSLIFSNGSRFDLSLPFGIEFRLAGDCWR